MSLKSKNKTSFLTSASKISFKTCKKMKVKHINSLKECWNIFVQFMENNKLFFTH